MEGNVNRYYLTEVDHFSESIYCYHNAMDELLIDQHTHKKAQFLYTEGGIVFVETETKKYYLPARHFMWIPANKQHSIRTNRADTRMFNLYFPVENGATSTELQEGVYPVNHLLFSMIEYAMDFERNLFPTDNQYIFAHAIQRILVDNVQSTLPFSLPTTQHARLSEVVNFLHTEAAADVSYAGLSKSFGFSERTLHRLFIKEMGISFVQYNTLLKMMKAIVLLMEGKLSVGEIALEVGYSSAATFSNTFQKFTGKRPSEYVKN